MTLSTSPEETQNIAKKIHEKIKNGGIVFLIGDLGTGKTVFTKGFSESLGIHNFKIKSPTYTYIREYPLKDRKFIHIDLYRFTEVDDLFLHELEELTANPKDIIIVEWADKLPEDFLTPDIKINFQYIDQNKREIKIL
jgi:tRNA threonylcarbamoyladenosine biosynthesis protein TsaE